MSNSLYVFQISITEWTYRPRELTLAIPHTPDPLPSSGSAVRLTLPGQRNSLHHPVFVLMIKYFTSGIIVTYTSAVDFVFLLLHCDKLYTVV